MSDTPADKLPPHNIANVRTMPSEALRDLAADVVTMATERHATGVSYSVLLGHLPETGRRSEAVAVWSANVSFGATDDTVAGGGAFTRAAREQEAEFGRGR